MNRKDLKIKIESHARNSLILEAFILQSAYIESLIRQFIEIRFRLSITKGDSKTINVIWEEIEGSKFSHLLNFAFNSGWISKDTRSFVGEYSQKRNNIIHDIIRQVERGDFNHEIKKIFRKGKKIIKFKEFLKIEHFVDVSQKQSLKLGFNQKLKDASVPQEERKITERENKVLKLRVIEGNTYEEIASKFKLTKERIRQIYEKAISKSEGISYKINNLKYPPTRNVNKNVERIIKVVSQLYNIRRNQLLSDSRKSELVFPRHIIYFLLREKAKLSFSMIAKIMNKKDHTTILHGYQKIDSLVRSGKIFVGDFDIKK